MENEIQSNNQLTSPTPVNFPSNWLKNLLLIVLGLVIAGSVFIGIQIGKNQTQNQQTVIALPTISPIQTIVNPTTLSITAKPSINSTTDWKTYTNTKNGYSIKYPESLLRLICPDEELTLTSRESDVRPGPIEMSTCARGGRYTLETKTYDSIQPEPKESKYYTIDTKNIVLGGLQGKQYTFTFTNIEIGPFPVWYTAAIVNKDGKTFEIYFDNKDSSPLFDQILSTFEFIN